jgi:hypothetical protein
VKVGGVGGWGGDAPDRWVGEGKGGGDQGRVDWVCIFPIVVA